MKAADVRPAESRWPLWKWPLVAICWALAEIDLYLEREGVRS